MAYYIYVLRCKGDTLYTGITRISGGECVSTAVSLPAAQIHPQPQTGGTAPGVGNCRPYCRSPV